MVPVTMPTPRLLRHRLVPTLLAALAASVAAARWLLQGDGNVYTDLAKRLYVADPDLGWRVASASPVWIGLDAVAALALIAVGSAAFIWAARRWRFERGWIHAVLLAVPVVALVGLGLAFASGSAPVGATTLLPAGSIEAPASGVSGAFPRIKAGAFEVLDHPESAITARITAGGESFDARFANGIAGHWSGDPSNFAAPMKALFRVPASAVDTGIALRSRHAREDYLQAGTHPVIELAIKRIIAIEQRAPGRVAFTAEATVSLIGSEQHVLVNGEMILADADAKARLNIGFAGDTFIVRAELSLRISETPLAADAGDFDGDVLPISTTLILVRSNIKGVSS